MKTHARIKENSVIPSRCYLHLTNFWCILKRYGPSEHKNEELQSTWRISGCNYQVIRIHKKNSLKVEIHAGQNYQEEMLLIVR
jgi:hypothetical protein